MADHWIWGYPVDRSPCSPTAVYWKLTYKRDTNEHRPVVLEDQYMKHKPLTATPGEMAGFVCLESEIIPQ